MHWNNDYKAWICTGLEYQEVLREKYGLPADWKPSEPEPIEWHPTGEWPHDWWKPTPPSGSEPSTRPAEALESHPQAPDPKT
jgi:hypothetical protein